MTLFLVRILRSLPLVVILVLLGIVIYYVITHYSSPNRAKEILIRVFTWIGIILSVFFGLVCIYAFAENNDTALDFALGFLAVALLALVIARICRAVFIIHNPKYKKKAVKTKKKPRRLK